ncbi:MAG TPA: hypothetical protein VF092_04050 [Longimicrobium sp.]
MDEAAAPVLRGGGFFSSPNLEKDGLTQGWQSQQLNSCSLLTLLTLRETLLFFHRRRALELQTRAAFEERERDGRWRSE